jgi:hypothetical protein
VLTYADASVILQHKFAFFSATTFTNDRHFHNKKERLRLAIECLINHGLIHQASGKLRFIKGAHASYAMATPGEIKGKNSSLASLTKLNLDIDQYEELWSRCLLPSVELAMKIEKSAIEHVKMHLNDYVRIIHHLGTATDPIAQEVLKPGLSSGQIGVDFDSSTFSLKPEHSLRLENDCNVIAILNKLCSRTIDPTSCSLTNANSSMSSDSDTSHISDDCLKSASEVSLVKEHSVIFTMPPVLIDDDDRSQREACTSSLTILTNERQNDGVANEDESFAKESHSHQQITEDNIERLMCSLLNDNTMTASQNTGDDDIGDCAFVLEEIQSRMLSAY